MSDFSLWDTETIFDNWNNLFLKKWNLGLASAKNQNSIQNEENKKIIMIECRFVPK